MYRINKAQSRQQSAVSSKRSHITLISAWRYPGRTKPGERPEIPLDVLEVLEEIEKNRV